MQIFGKDLVCAAEGFDSKKELLTYLYSCKRRLVGNVKYDEETVRVRVELIADINVFGPTGHIPQMHPQLEFVNFGDFESIVNSHCCLCTECSDRMCMRRLRFLLTHLVRVTELALAKVLDQAGFATLVCTNANQFDPNQAVRGIGWWPLETAWRAIHSWQSVSVCNASAAKHKCL